SVVAPERAAPGETRGMGDLDPRRQEAEQGGVVSGLERLVEPLDGPLIARWHGPVTACTCDAAQSPVTERMFTGSAWQRVLRTGDRVVDAATERSSMSAAERTDDLSR